MLYINQIKKKRRRAWTPGRFCEVASHGKAFSFFPVFLKKISINCRFFTQKEHLPAQEKETFCMKKITFFFESASSCTFCAKALNRRSRKAPVASQNIPEVQARRRFFLFIVAKFHVKLLQKWWIFFIFFWGQVGVLFE